VPVYTAPDNRNTEPVGHQYREKGVSKSDYYCCVECLIEDYADLAERIVA